MSNFVRSGSVAAVVVVAAVGALTGCSAQAASSTVEYRVTTSAEQLGAVRYHTVQPGAGAVDFADTVRKQSWSKTVDGGRSPSVTVTAPLRGEVTCEIRDADGKVLVREQGKDGATAKCAAGERLPS
ncbi:hypothetical protein [Curtobacterium sp. L1-20]|uniref:hypothetical protein n=1 Tax=Curtobacterium sp. L1-20 TaxID=3138181 RepID=UPI003B5189FC